MRDPFVFDSRSEFCKSPYGAAPCGGRVTFHVRPLYAEGYSRCVLVAWREFSNSADTLELMPEGTDGDRTRFSGVLTPDGHKNKGLPFGSPLFLVTRRRFELRTHCLKGNCSAN